MFMRTMQASSFTVFALVAVAVVAVSAQDAGRTPAIEEAAYQQDITACGTALQSSAADVSAVGAPSGGTACRTDSLKSDSASMPLGPWGSCRGDCSPCLGSGDCEHAGGGWICDPECM
ncbi:hypothetical protein POL68_14240 [Stigmatella sp. ncwal1]|uniref:Uncharacterized protein n=1 Tax=Stigmatella ashevillensis TaxID=2995309 RepID=A0ABT5D7J8_9BACT|nr:hypothetical protein [Stigmatella ashevillena]MDC0709627.1 hypothetical protein [Stigmatella ashevillena]